MPQIRLKVTGNNRYDELFVNKNNVANNGYKFFSMNPAVPQLYITDNQTNYAIYNIHDDPQGLALPVGFKSSANGSYTIEIMSGSFEDYDVELKDKAKNSMVSIVTGNTYTFRHEQGIPSERFELVFKLKSLTGTKAEETVPCRIYASGMGIIAESGRAVPAQVDVYSINGSLVARKAAASSKSYIPVSRQGIYIVRLMIENKIFTEKIVITK